MQDSQPTAVVVNDEAPASGTKSVADSLPALWWIASPDGRLEATNQRFNDTLGAHPDEPGTSLLAFLACAEDVPRLQLWWATLNQNGRHGEIELRLLRKDGTASWFLVITAPRRTLGGVLHWNCIGVEIEERKRAETLLQQREEEFRTITDAISQYVVVLAPDGTVTYVNRVVIDETGFSLNEVGSGQDAFARPFHPEDIDRVRLERSEGLARGNAFQLEVRVSVLSGHYRWYLMQYKPLMDVQGRVLRWYVTGTDIHEQREQRDMLQRENVALREELRLTAASSEIIGTSAPVVQLHRQLQKIAKTDSTVLILGETGTGKELVARALHRLSDRSKKPFIRVNCAAIPQSLIASELFGHEKGAFTGATQRREGKFEAADGGTLFLDEVGDLPMETQVALLRVLQEREIERIGSNVPVSVDIRLVAATHRDLLEGIKTGSFREDLFYRLNVLPITMPSLRDRLDDIPLLVERFVAHFCQKSGRRIRHIEKRTLARLETYRWPGNIRELQNVIERAVILSDTDTLFFDETWLHQAESATRAGASGGLPDLLQRERTMIVEALRETGGRVSGPSGAAAKLGIPRQTLESKMKKFGIMRS